MAESAKPEVVGILTDAPLLGSEVIASIGMSIQPDKRYKQVHYMVAAEIADGSYTMDAGHINLEHHSGVMAGGEAGPLDENNPLDKLYLQAVTQCSEMTALLNSAAETIEQTSKQLTEGK